MWNVHQRTNVMYLVRLSISDRVNRRESNLCWTLWEWAGCMYELIVILSEYLVYLFRSLNNFNITNIPEHEMLKGIRYLLELGYNFVQKHAIHGRYFIDSYMSFEVFVVLTCKYAWNLCAYKLAFKAIEKCLWLVETIKLVKS